MALPDIPALRATHTGNLADVVDWWQLFASHPTVIGTKTGLLQTTLRYVCPDVEHLQPAERGAYLRRLHDVLMLLEEGWHMDADWWHEDAPSYPEAQWTHPGHWLVDEIRRDDFVSHPRHTSTAYLTLSWQRPKAASRWLSDVFYTKGAQRAERRDLDHTVDLFQRGVERFTDLLRPLWLQVEPLDEDQTCTYLHASTSWDRHTVRTPMCRSDLDWQLTSSTWLPGSPCVLDGRLVQPITISTWQESLSIWLPESLACLPFPCRYHVRWTPLSLQAANSHLTWQLKKWAGSNVNLAGTLKKMSGRDKEEGGTKARDERADAARITQSLLEVRDRIMTGQTRLGWLKVVVLVWANDYEELRERVRVMTTCLFSHGLVARVEEAGAAVEWLGSVPGNVRLGTRYFPLETPHLTGLIPHGTVWPGKPWNDHLKAPAQLVASSDETPFWFCSHVGENGNRLVIGPTRGGKSGFVGVTTRQWFRYPKARKVIWDKEYAHKALTLLSGGMHYDLGAPGCSGFHVLGRIDTDAERTWALSSWLEPVLIGEGLPPDAHERQELWEALKRLAGLHPHLRTMTNYRKLMQVQRLKIGLAPFCQGGPFGFFDASEDAFGLDARFVTFEMNTLFGEERAIGPTLSYLFHRLEKEWFNGDPVNITMEEARWLLDLKRFLGNVTELLKAKAKVNVSVEIVCQEVYDLARTEAWQAILASAPTLILLPNYKVFSENVRPFYEELDVDETEMHLIQRGQPHRDYLYHSPLGKRLFQLQLDPAERLLCAASSVEERATLDMLAAVHSPEELPAAWLAHWGYEDHAKWLIRAQEAQQARLAEAGERVRQAHKAPAFPLPDCGETGGQLVSSAPNGFVADVVEA